MIKAGTPTSPCMAAHHEMEKNRFYYVNYAAILFNKIALSENVQMGISTDNLGMGLSAILKGVYQVRAIGSGTTLPPSVFTHTVPANMTVGKSYQVAFSGVTSAKGAVTYTLSSPANLGSMLGFSKSTGILADEDITVSVHADTGGGTHSTAVPGNYSLEVRAYAGQTLVSTHTVDFTLVAAVLGGNITVSGAGGTTTAGSSATFSFSGITTDSGTVKYGVANTGHSYFTFSKSTNIAENESITATAASNTPTGSYNFTVSANTSPSASNGPRNAVFNQQVTAAVVTPTLSGTITVSGASGMTNAGSSATFRFSGVTADTGTVTYSIANSGQSYFTFSKSTNIAANEAITVTAATNTPTGSYNFTISANTSPSASNGPVTGSCSQSVTAAVVTPTLSGTITHNIPSTATAANNYNVRFSGKSATSGQVLYSVNVNSGSQYVSFSKTSGITDGETVIMSVASNAPNGGSISGTISANTSPVGASNGPDSVGFSLSTLAIVEPDPSFSGFNHTVPANTQQGQSYTVTFSGTSSSNGRQVWYSLSPQTGLSFSKLDNISPGEAVTMTVSGSASGTLGVSVYANTTKNSGSTFTKSVAYIQTAVAVPVTVDMDHMAIQFDMVSPGPSTHYGPYWEATYKVNISGMRASDGRQIFFEIRNVSWSKVYASATAQGNWATFVGPAYNDFDDPVIVAVDSAGKMYGTRYLSGRLNVTPWGNFGESLPIYVVH